MVGARFDPYALKEFDKSIFPFLLLLLIIFPLVKVIPALLWKRFFGLKNAISAGFLISARLSLIIAASKIGLDMGLITPGMNSCFIIMAVVSCMISPILYNNLTPMGFHNSKSTIIVGGSSTGVLLQRRLNIHGKKALIIEKNYKRFKEMKSKGLITLLGDGKDPETYNKLKISPSNYIFVHTGSDKENRTICEMLQKKFTPAQIITKTIDQKTEQKLKQLNIEVIDMTRIVATTIENLIVRPTTYHALVETFENYSVEEIKMTNPKIDGHQVSELHFHSDGSLMLINRNNQMHVPHGDTYLKIGDEIIVFGTDVAIDDFKIKFKG